MVVSAAFTKQGKAAVRLRRKELGMRTDDIREYLRLCLRYRGATVLLCTAVYLLPAAGGTGFFLRLWIAGGMLLAGFLSSALYAFAFHTGASESWLKVLLVLELFSYGLLTCLSGGLYSPYLWYYISCLFMMLSLRQSFLFTGLGILWCILCVVTGHLAGVQGTAVGQPVYNLATGGVVVIGAFYVLLGCIHRLDEAVRQQSRLNARLREEKERSEQALGHITELYDTLNLFAMSDPDRVMEALVQTLCRTIAPGGCVLVKCDPEGGVERREVREIEEEEAEAVWSAATEALQEAGSGWRPVRLESEQLKFECVYIGERTLPKGLLLRRTGTSVPEKQDLFYRGVIEIVFRNMDTHRELETYIAAEEKNRMADEIHDTVIQRLFALACGLKMLEGKTADSMEEDRNNQIRLLMRSTEGIMKELREAIYGKRFESSGAQSFTGRVRTYLSEMESMSGAQIQLEIDERAEEMTASQKIVLYRISCEAVSNAVCHGRARRIALRLALTDREICMEVQDNGSGLSIPSGESLRGNGLRNMNRMVSLLRGQILLEAGENRGTAVRLRLPRR